MNKNDKNDIINKAKKAQQNQLKDHIFNDTTDDYLLTNVLLKSLSFIYSI